MHWHWEWTYFFGFKIAKKKQRNLWHSWSLWHLPMLVDGWPLQITIVIASWWVTPVGHHQETNVIPHDVQTITLAGLVPFWIWNEIYRNNSTFSTISTLCFDVCQTKIMHSTNQDKDFTLSPKSRKTGKSVILYLEGVFSQT